jgi:hypothetical protein
VARKRERRKGNANLRSKRLKVSNGDVNPPLTAGGIVGLVSGRRLLLLELMKVIHLSKKISVREPSKQKKRRLLIPSFDFEEEPTSESKTFF